MGQSHIIDSNVIIDYMNRSLPKSGMTFMRSVVNKTPNISVISKIEVLSYTNIDSKNILKEFVDSSVIFDLTSEIVTKTIEVRQKKNIKVADAIIAATALIFDFTLLTRNTDDFKNITGLKIINPWLMQP